MTLAATRAARLDECKRLEVTYRGPLTGRAVSLTLLDAQYVQVGDQRQWLVGRTPDGFRCSIAERDVLAAVVND